LISELEKKTGPWRKATKKKGGVQRSPACGARRRGRTEKARLRGVSIFPKEKDSEKVNERIGHGSAKTRSQRQRAYGSHSGEILGGEIMSCNEKKKTNRTWQRGERLEVGKREEKKKEPSFKDNP